MVEFAHRLLSLELMASPAGLFPKVDLHIYSPVLDLQRQIEPLR
jgi:hypothetical protein